jgi:ribosomal protein L40E
MSVCRNCGQSNAGDTNFCRFCGTRMALQAEPAVSPFGFTAPRPYAWKTDEFQTKAEARRTPSSHAQPAILSRESHESVLPSQFSGYQPIEAFRCPRCTSQVQPRVERRISTTGWIVFAVLLVLFFPLFWIGLLIKEDVRVCRSCDARVP